MITEYKITHEEMIKLGDMLGEAPAKFALPCIDLLREITRREMEQKKEKESDAEQKSN